MSDKRVSLLARIAKTTGSKEDKEIWLAEHNRICGNNYIDYAAAVKNHTFQVCKIEERNSDKIGWLTGQWCKNKHCLHWYMRIYCNLCGGLVDIEELG